MTTKIEGMKVGIAVYSRKETKAVELRLQFSDDLTKGANLQKGDLFKVDIDKNVIRLTYVDSKEEATKKPQRGYYSLRIMSNSGLGVAFSQDDVDYPLKAESIQWYQAVVDGDSLVVTIPPEYMATEKGFGLLAKGKAALNKVVSPGFGNIKPRKERVFKPETQEMFPTSMKQ